MDSSFKLKFAQIAVRSLKNSFAAVGLSDCSLSDSWNPCSTILALHFVFCPTCASFSVVTHMLLTFICVAATGHRPQPTLCGRNWQRGLLLFLPTFPYLLADISFGSCASLDLNKEEPAVLTKGAKQFVQNPWESSLNAPWVFVAAKSYTPFIENESNF